MSPQIGKEICLTSTEVKLMAVFVQEKLFNDQDCAEKLEHLAKKLRGEYAKKD